MIRDADLLVLLHEEREKQRDRSKSLDLYVALIALRAQENPPVPVDWLALAGFRMERGEAALSSDELQPECGRFAKLAQEICRIAIVYRPEFSESLTRIATQLAAVSAREMRSIVTAYLEHKNPGLEVDPSLFDFVMDHALYPIRHAYAVAAAPILKELDWLRGSCPVCSGYPDMAALEGPVGGRRLLCARCDSEWTYRRIGCPFCDDEEPRSLSYFTNADGAYRLYVCECCKGYLKTIDMRQTRRVRPLALERLLTVGMDLAAAAHGYRRTPEAALVRRNSEEKLREIRS